MASLNLPIWIQQRSCYVNGKKAMFHTWVGVSEIVAPSVLKGGHSGGVISDVLGLVEYEDGTVAKVNPNKIRFADGGGFGDHVWLHEESQ